MIRSIMTAVAIMLATACQAANEPTVQSEADAFASTAPAMAKARAAEGMVAQVQNQAPTDRKMIRTAQLRIELEDVARAVRSADSIAIAAQGVLANSQSTHGEGGATEAQLTLRVPADRFAIVLDRLRSLGRVRMDNTSAEDVTRSYNDLEIRLAVKRDVVARLRALLTNRTARLADLLAAERELGRAVTELEQMEGERRYLDNQIAMTTIHVTFYHAPVVGPQGFLDPIAVAVRQTLVVLGQSVATVISIGVFVAPWIVLLTSAWWIGRRLRRRGAAARPEAA
jgi:hypothetical protein